MTDINADQSADDFTQDILELRLRLEEAEETLRAIREGEIDGLIVSGSQGEQVYTLTGAEHPYRVLIEEMNEGALTVAADGTILYCNRSFNEMAGSEYSLIGRFIWEFVYFQEKPHLPLNLECTSGKTQGEASLVKSNGSTIPVYYSIKPMLMEGVQICLIVITDLSEMRERASELKSANEQLTKEIQERVKTEAQLRQSRAMFAKVFYASPIMMAVVTVKDGIYIDVNQAFCQGLGYTWDELVGRSTRELNIYADYSQRAQYVPGLEQQGRLDNIELTLRTKAGDIRQVVCWSQLIDLNQQLCHISGLIDVTEQRYMEREISRLDRLNLIGEMAASIGHEIRNPITAIRGFLQMLNEDDRYQDKTYFEFMIEELDRANGIISEYLGMAKNKHINLVPKSLNEVIESLYPMLMADANYQEKNLCLELSRTPLTLIDENEIRQLILNLTRNGLEAMVSGGTTTIATQCEGDAVTLIVKDQGHGIPAEMLDKMGTPFVTTKDNGTGLGLAVCYSIAARHNAQITCDTCPQGTTFKIHFPLPDEQPSLF